MTKRRSEQTPTTPELSAVQIAVMLDPMPVPPAVYEAAHRESDEAIRFARSKGLPTDPDYKFLKTEITRNFTDTFK